MMGWTFLMPKNETKDETVNDIEQARSPPSTRTTSTAQQEQQLREVSAAVVADQQQQERTPSLSSPSSDDAAANNDAPEGSNDISVDNESADQTTLIYHRVPTLHHKHPYHCQSSMSNVNPALPCASISFNYKATKPPKETLHAIYKAGEYKANLPLNLLVVQSFMAGVYIGMAGHLYLAVGGKVLGAALFPTGLIAVVLTSAELFTGDALVFVASFLGGKVELKKLLRNWSVAWLCNFAGCVFWASLVAFSSDSLEDLDQVELAIKVARKKVLQPWSHIFVKAIGANFMVCVGVWQATCAEEVAGKVLAIWFPISGFVLMGLEHVVANQFLIPVAMMYGGVGDDVVSLGRFWSALSAATLGNIVGGGLLVGAVYWYVYDSMTSKQKQQQQQQQQQQENQKTMTEKPGMVKFR